LRWDAHQLEALIAYSFPGWSINGKRKLLEITSAAMSPGIITKFRYYISRKSRKVSDFFDLDQGDISLLTYEVKERADQWAEFKDAENSMRITAAPHIGYFSFPGVTIAPLFSLSMMCQSANTYRRIDT
jgi:hypothetical protein